MAVGMEPEPYWTLIEYLWCLKVPLLLHISVTLHLIIPVKYSHTLAAKERNTACVREREELVAPSRMSVAQIKMKESVTLVLV